MKRLRFPLLSLLLLAAPLAAPAADVEPRFNITVVNTPAKSFFLGLVYDTPYNMVVSADVSGSISLDLKQVTVPEVLQMTRELYGYDFEKLPAGFLVLPATIQSRMFYVNYVDLERSGTSRTRVSSGQLTQSGQLNASNVAVDPYAAQAGQNGASGQNGQPANHGPTQTGTTVDTKYKVNFWQELELSLREMLPKDNGHSVVVNPQSGVVAVRAMPNELNDVAKFLAKINSTAAREVILEAKIIEVDLNDDYQAGDQLVGFAEERQHQLFRGPEFSVDLQRRPARTERPHGQRLAGQSRERPREQHLGWRVHLGARRKGFQCLRQSAAGAGKYARALESARLDTQQSEGRDQIRLRPILRHQRNQQYGHLDGRLEHQFNRVDAVLLGRCARRHAADRR